MVYLSSHGSKSYWDIPYTDNIFLIFGKESVGLPKSIIQENLNNTFKIPIFNKNIRSLNLANSVGIVVYEGLKKLNTTL